MPTYVVTAYDFKSGQKKDVIMFSERLEWANRAADELFKELGNATVATVLSHRDGRNTNG